MRSSALVRFLGFALATSSAIVACGGDDDDDDADGRVITKSGLDESCTRSDDCESGLACFDNVCLEEPAASTGGTGGSTGGSGGSTGKGGSGGTGKGGTGGSTAGSTSTPPPVLSGEGESCTRTADCEDGLGCFNQRCSEGASGGGDAGSGNGPAPTLGGLGETCVLTSDCRSGYVCMPSSFSAGVGVCMPSDSGLEPTGKTCGAECVTEEDCCELPLELHAQLGANSCAQMEVLLDGIDCSATTVPLEMELCFALTAYCDCDDDTWSCTNGACNYTAPCSTDGLAPGGCATYSRSGNQLIFACDADSNRCRAPALVAVCESDDDCESELVADDPTDTCTADECVCANAACYRRCGEDLDCAAGKMCSDDDVCVPIGGCMSDNDCKVQLQDIRAVCDSGTCNVSCQTDLDCNVLTGGLLRVCNEDNLCESLGCNDHDECMKPDGDGIDGNERRMFCTAPAAVPGGTMVSSAITD